MLLQHLPSTQALQRFAEFAGDHPRLAAAAFGDLGQHRKVLVGQQLWVGRAWWIVVNAVSIA
jgi:hypothetical protein